MSRVRAYTREERKRLIIYLFAERIRQGNGDYMSCSEIAKAMDITASTKLRKILFEMRNDNILVMEAEKDAGIAGYRYLYWLNPDNVAFGPSHSNHRAAKRARQIRLNIGGKVEALTLQ